MFVNGLYLKNCMFGPKLMPLEALSKAKIKWLRSLQQKKNREAEKVFVIEGEKMVREGLETIPDQLVALIVHKDFGLPEAYTFAAVYSASTTEMEQISAFKTPNKLVAVFRRVARLPEQEGFGLALDGIQDPGNMGTILRLADWFGISTILCSLRTVDCYNPKVIQASMGAIFRISVQYTDLEAYLKTQNRPVYAALLDGENYSSITYPKKGILLMGNEGSGIDNALLPMVTKAVTIPRIGAAESLNVATATAILLAELHRSG